MNSPLEINDYLASKMKIIHDAECEIDKDEPLYMFTWSPDVKDGLPDANFDVQHEYTYGIITDYLKYCRCGCACVESSQMGNPHYHGWYQVSEDYEEGRIVIAKVLQKTGNLKITKSKGHFRYHCFHNHSNCLYYYKKDLGGSMFSVSKNPIVADTPQSTVDWNAQYFLFMKDIGRRTVSEIQDTISNKFFYRQFYANKDLS